MYISKCDQDSIAITYQEIKTKLISEGILSGGRVLTSKFGRYVPRQSEKWGGGGPSGANLSVKMRGSGASSSVKMWGSGAS